MKLILELCQNHNGDRDLVRELVKSASRAGASHVKIQSMYAANLTYRTQFEEGFNLGYPYKRAYQAEYDRLKNLELTLDDHKLFIDLCVEYDLIPMTTIFDKANVERICSLDWPTSIVKVASYDAASPGLLSELTKRFDKLIISTGATYDEEVAWLSRWMREQNPRTRFSLLHCVTKYPQSIDDSRLLRISWLRQFCGEVGLSDHSSRRNPICLSLCSIYLGIDYLERHYSVLPEEKTKDGPVSITEAEARELVEFSQYTKDEQLSLLLSRYGEETIRKVFTYQAGMSDYQELLNRDYYRGRFASRSQNGDYDYNWF